VPDDLRDRIVRFSRWAEALREAGILLVIFGPVSIAEIFKTISLAKALAVWAASAVGLLIGIEWDVYIERKKHRLFARGLW
jgi:hypothetical protein